MTFQRKADQRSGDDQASSVLLDLLVQEFSTAVGIKFQPSDSFRASFIGTFKRVPKSSMLPPEQRYRGLIGSINAKTGLHHDSIASLYNVAAAIGITFNHAEKRSIEEAFDFRDDQRFVDLIVRKKLDEDKLGALINYFRPLEVRQTLSAFKSEYVATTNPRLGVVDVSMTVRMVSAIFAEFVFRSFEKRAMHQALAPYQHDYHPDFWSMLHDRADHLFDRREALWVARFDANDLANAGSYQHLRDQAVSIVSEAYSKISNHGTLVISIADLAYYGREVQWELAADITLFAERFVEEELRKGYFRKDEIERETVNYIPGLSRQKSSFHLANTGFSYADCFVINPESSKGSNLLLVFQKHVRDETPIPCPACRSGLVEGNSYSALGVRSWECKNLICPDRSKSNRGKRFSFLSLLKQRATDDPENEISAKLVRAWRRDVVFAGSDQIVDMAVRHYSLAGDGVTLFNLTVPIEKSNRSFKTQPFPIVQDGLFDRFTAQSFFKRFLVQNRPTGSLIRNQGDQSFRVLQGDARVALQSVPTGTIDGAVTSPPYYNAREYSNWPNLYCYMADMVTVAEDVLRVLKPGALFLYNIFDYFDNDRTITFSAMGQKRISLSAITVHAFRTVGFTILGNIVWDKGDIEGKRGFNGGNFSPYYQLPFNCWEHVLVFAKPGGNPIPKFDLLPRYIQQKPVIKMVKGKNIHGHSAPFPEAIPELLINTMSFGETVLDPFAGSLTTGRVAERRGVNSISIELEPRYCELGLAMRDQERYYRQGSLSL